MMTREEAKRELKDAYASISDVLQNAYLGAGSNRSVHSAQKSLKTVLKRMH